MSCPLLIFSQSDLSYWYKFSYLITNSADSEEANCSGSPLFPKAGHTWVQQDLKYQLHSRDICEKAKQIQNSARNIAKCSKCFQFLCNNSNLMWFFNALTFARSLGRCWKPRPPASVFNTSLSTWRMLMHEKLCLIHIVLFEILGQGW